jgi:hypothetical protein
VMAAIEWCTPGEERDVSQALKTLAIDADWIVREGVTQEFRVATLQSVLSQVTGKAIVIEPRLLPRPVLVVRGEWKLVPLDPGIFAQRVCLYVTEGDQRAGLRENKEGSFDEFCQYIRDETRYRVIDETDGAKPARIAWSDCMWRQRPHHGEEALIQFLSNVQKQTSLRFQKEIRPVPGWYAGERSPTTQPGGAS